MTYVLVVSNVISLVAMFIAAWWGYTYPGIVIDGYESGKSAIVASFMCILSCICLCGLNFQNYYLLVLYGCAHIIVMINQIFSLLPFSWTRIPNYPVTGDISTQVYILILPKILLVIFSFLIAWKIRQDEIQRKLSRSDPRCRCGSTRSNFSRASQRSFHNVNLEGPPPPPPLPPPNAIIRTPPLYPLHRPSLPGPPPGPPPMPINRTPPHFPINGPLSGPPGTPPWSNERKWGSVGREYGHYYRDVYNPNY